MLKQTGNINKRNDMKQPTTTWNNIKRRQTRQNNLNNKYKIQQPNKNYVKQPKTTSNNK